MMTPVARLVLVRATPKRELVSAMAWLTVPALVGPLVGPPVGGFITTFFTWHWIFLINVPIGLIGIWLADTLPARRRAGRRPAARRRRLRAVGDRRLRRGVRPVGGQPAGAAADRRHRRRWSSGWCRGVALCPARQARPPIRSSISRCSANPVFRAAIIGGIDLPHRQRRRAVPAAADVPARLRHDAVPVGHADLCLGARRHRDEVPGADHAAGSAASAMC